MLNRRALFTAAALAFVACPGFAQDDGTVRNDIENIHGDADGFFDLFAILQDAAANGDKAAIAEHTLYPLLVNADGESREVAEAQDLIDDFDALIYPETLETLVDQDVNDLIVTGEGVGVGNGAIWLTNVCLDEACATTRWGILSINN